MKYCVFLALAALPVLAADDNTQKTKDAQQMPSATAQVDETLKIGTATLKLGMPREYVIAELSEYDLVLDFGVYWVRAGGKPNSEVIAQLYFDESGALVEAHKFLTTTLRNVSEGEIGRVLFNLIRRLPNGGACSFLTMSNTTGKKAQYRDAYIECGRKRYGFKTLTVDEEDSLNITEEIRAHSGRSSAILQASMRIPITGSGVGAGERVLRSAGGSGRREALTHLRQCVMVRGQCPRRDRRAPSVSGPETGQDKNRGRTKFFRILVSRAGIGRAFGHCNLRRILGLTPDRRCCPGRPTPMFSLIFGIYDTE